MDRGKKLKSELSRVLARWKKDPSVRQIILFGSLADGTVRSGSDIDLIIVQETGKKFLQRLEPFYLDSRTAMDILVYTPDEFREMKERNFLKQALNNSVILYEAGHAQRRKKVAEAG